VQRLRNKDIAGSQKFINKIGRVIEALPILSGDDQNYFFPNFFLPSPARPNNPVPKRTIVPGSGIGFKEALSIPLSPGTVISCPTHALLHTTNAHASYWVATVKVSDQSVTQFSTAGGDNVFE
jgi:hypothetical protein